MGAGAWLTPQPRLSPYKLLAQARAWPETEVICHDEGPLGRIDVLAGPMIHHTPGLGLNWREEVPRHVLLVFDGDQASSVYDCPSRRDWAFLDHTTPAIAYHLRPSAASLILGAGGGADIGLAVFHSAQVVALEMNGQVIRAMTGALAERGGRIYTAPGVRVLKQEARQYLLGGKGRFDVIQLPPLDAYGSSAAGLHATQESHLYTVEAFGAMLDRLADGGVLCITRWVRLPPYEGLRVFDTAAAALRARGLDPAGRLVMIRGLGTETVLVLPDGVSPAQCRTVRAFCRDRSFDLCYLPGMAAAEANRYNVLDRPYYYEAATALLGPGREEFLAGYLYSVRAATDDRPYFFRFFRWRMLREVARQAGGMTPAFLERGYLMLAAALAQTVLLGAVLIVLPLLVRLRTLRRVPGKLPCLAYFLLLGAGYMLLEIGYLQRLILYLAHPIYAAAVAIAGFLAFSGLGSLVCRRWPGRPDTVARTAAAAVVGICAAYLFGLDRWLALTQAQPAPVRFLVAAATLAPLAFAMGHLFPLGLQRVSSAAAPLVPWAWAVNGFASVAATVAAPLLAMEVGFPGLCLAAIAAYVPAALIFTRLPTPAAPP